MRKILLTFSLLYFCSSVSAQKKFFFESVEANFFIYADDIFYGKNEWAKQFKSPYHASSQNLDSLNEQPHKGWAFQINGGEGIQTRLQKLLPVFTSHPRRRLEWNTGLGFRTFRMRSNSYFYYTSFYDTTTIPFRESERFQLRQSFLDVYNSVVYTSHSKLLSGLYAFIGAGFQTSFTLSSKIKDTYYSGEQKWNTAQRRWEDININNDTSFIPAKSCLMYGWTLPVGWGIDLSEKFSLEGAIEYYHAWRSPALIEKKYSEGVMFQMIIRYKL